MQYHDYNQHRRHFGGRGGAGAGAGFGMRGGRGFGWDGNGGGGGRGGGRRRVFDSGELRILLLALLAEQPRHGYDLIREIEDRTGGAYAPSPGVVYPTLTLLDEMSLIDEVKEEGARKRFAITEAGRAHLTEHKATADGITARLADLGKAQGRNAAPIQRALTGLHMALRDALAAGAGRENLVHELAEAIDAAALRIERL